MKKLLKLSADFRRRYDQYLRDNPHAGAVAAKLVPRCNLLVMANLVRDSLPEYGGQAYEVLRRLDEQKKSELECAISGLRAAAKIARRSGQTEDAARWESEASHFGEILSFVTSDSRPKALGALRGKELPGALLYLVCLEEYIAAKTGRKPRPSETAHIVSALLMGFDRYPHVGVDPDLLAKRLKQFRKRKGNHLWIEDMRRRTECDSSGENFLDRIYGKTFIADGI